jgi:HK97 family phage prohead protease
MKQKRPQLKSGDRVHTIFAFDILKADDSKRTIEHIITKRVVDRAGDVVEPRGGRFDAYKKNPVVLFGHDSWNFPVGRNLSLTPSDTEIAAVTQFAGLDQAHPEAETAYRLARDGFLKAWSIGFMPITWSEDKALPHQDGWWFKEWELYEYSLVPIPANPDAVTSFAKAYGLPIGATERDLLDHIKKDRQPYWDVAASLTRAARRPSMLKTVPPDVSKKIADPNTSWSAPALGDFTSDGWDGLSDEQKRQVAGHFAWTDEMPPASFESLKLPHHRASDGAVVIAGLAAAWGRIDQTEGIDAEAVRTHLRSHYHDAGLEAPDEEQTDAATTPIARARQHIAAAVSELGRAAVLDGKPELLDVAKKLAEFSKDFEPPATVPMQPDKEETVPVKDVVEAALKEISESTTR